MTGEFVSRFLEEERYLALRRELSKMNPVDLAELLSILDAHQLFVAYRLLPKSLASNVFSYFTPLVQERLISVLSDREVYEILSKLYFDDMIDVLEEMPASVVQAFLSATSEHDRRRINEFLNYPEDSAASVMTIEYIELKENMTAFEALEHIRKVGQNKETIYHSYVSDSEKHLKGVVSLKRLILSPPEVLVKELIQESGSRVYALDKRENVARLFKKYDLIAMPVVDKEERLLGIITIDDVMDIIEEETTEDIEKMAAINPLENRYLDNSFWEMAWKRLPWLFVLMISATLTSSVIAYYTGVLERVLVLATFIPLLMNSAGNAGAQSATLVIRSLALGYLDMHHWWKVFCKEIAVALIVGFSLAFFNFVRLLLFEPSLRSYENSWMIAFLVSTTLFVAIILAKIAGGLLPLLAKRIHLDPALMAGPFITTLVDVMTLLVYFRLVEVFLAL